MSEAGVAALLAPEAQRLLGFMALQDRPVSRATVAWTLWPEASEMHAYASLRSALARLSPAAHDALVVTGTTLALASHIRLDLRDARALARAILDGRADAIAPRGVTPALRVLSAECLPGWYEDWAVIESEEWRQLRLHALDALTAQLTDRGRFADAMAAALASVRAEPLRESACAALIRVHLAEGNQSEAIRTFSAFAALMAGELGIEPTPALFALVPQGIVLQPAESAVTAQ